MRAAMRIGDALHAPWTAVYVETPCSASFGDADHRWLAALMKLATQLGGAVATVAAASVVEGLEAFVGEARATPLVVGKSSRSRWVQLRHGSVIDRLICEMAGDRGACPADRGGRGTCRRLQAGRHCSKRIGYAWPVAMVAAVTAAASGRGNAALTGFLRRFTAINDPVALARAVCGRSAGCST